MVVTTFYSKFLANLVINLTKVYTLNQFNKKILIKLLL